MAVITLLSMALLSIDPSPFIVSEAFMIGDVEVSCLKGVMDVRHSFLVVLNIALTTACHSFGLTIDPAWSSLYLQQPRESLQLYPVFTIASLVKHARKHNLTQLRVMTNQMNFSRYAQTSTTHAKIHPRSSIFCKGFPE